MYRVQILDYIFNPTFGFVHIWPNFFVGSNMVNQWISESRFYEYANEPRPHSLTHSAQRSTGWGSFAYS